LGTHHSYKFLKPAIAVGLDRVDELQTLLNLTENIDNKEDIVYALSEIALTELLERAIAVVIALD
jgi:hypothetical protein